MITLDQAGTPSIYSRLWEMSQGADNSNGIRPYTLDVDGVTRLYTDWTTHTARAQIRDSVGGTVWLDMNSAALSGARIELTADGWVRLLVPAAVTEATDWDTRDRGVYDLEVIDAGGAVTRLMSGKVKVSHDVTRAVA